MGRRRYIPVVIFLFLAVLGTLISLVHFLPLINTEDWFIELDTNIPEGGRFPPYREQCGLVIDSSDNIYVLSTKGWIGNYGYDPKKIIYLFKYDNSGTLLWNETIAEGHEDNYGTDIALDSDEKIYITGSINDKVFLEKWDKEGNLIWERVWDDGRGSALAIDSDNNIYITQYGYENYLIKYNSSGEQLWNTSLYYSSKEPALDEQYTLTVATDSLGNVYAGGYLEFYSNALSMFLIKYNSSGTQLWNITDAEANACINLAIDSNDNLYINVKNPYSLLIKYTNLGIQVWNKSLEFTTNNVIYKIDVYSLISDSSNNVFVAGTLNFNGFFLEYLNFDISIIIQLELNWRYNTFLDMNIPHSSFSIKYDNTILLKIDTGLITFSEDTYLLRPTDHGQYDSSDNLLTTKNTMNSDSVNEYHSIKSSQPADIDKDGLPDTWEVNNADIFSNLFGSHPLTVGTKDLIVEVDYVEGFQPCTESDELLGLVFAIILTILDVITIISAVALTTAAGSDIISVPMKTALDLWAVFLTIFTGIWWIYKPYESFNRITEYFNSKDGYNIHILYNPQNSKISLNSINSIAGLENFDGWGASDAELRIIESNFHNDPRQRYNNENLGVYILYIGSHKDGPGAWGKTDTDSSISNHFGAVILTNRWAGNPWGFEYFTFGHELGHILHLDHSDESAGFMNREGLGLFEINLAFPGLFHYGDAEWNNMDFINRFSAGP